MTDAVALTSEPSPTTPAPPLLAAVPSTITPPAPVCPPDNECLADGLLGPSPRPTQVPDPPRLSFDLNRRSRSLSENQCSGNGVEPSLAIQSQAPMNP